MPQKSLVLILARDLAEKLASAMFVVDHEGTLVYFNEPAERILGKTFSDVGPVPLDEWPRAFSAQLANQGLTLENLPLFVALRDREPTHREFTITGVDGRPLSIAATAFPLFARTDEFVGAASIFWEVPASESGSAKEG
jgi:PAS domain-containing protein